MDFRRLDRTAKKILALRRGKQGPDPETTLDVEEADFVVLDSSIGTKEEKGGEEDFEDSEGD